MSTIVSVHEKKTFIKWFLKTYELRKRECTWILKYLVQHEKHLEQVHFVRDTDVCPRAMIMSTHCSNSLPFRFSKHSISTEDVEKSFHDLRLDYREPLYIQLNFHNAHQCPFYARVLEENPFTQQHLYVTDVERHYGERILNDAIYDSQVKILKKDIDHALEQRDKQTFIRLSEQLKKIETDKHFTK